MALFTSKRERRLWLWTIAACAAIFATLALSGTMALQLASQNVAAGFFLLASLLVLVTALVQGLKGKPSGAQLMVFLGILAAYIMIGVRMNSQVERSHLIEYGVVAIFIFEALKERKSNGRNVPAPALLAIVATSLIGLIDECAQLFIPHRVFDPVDIAFNTLAAVMIVGSSLAFAWVKRYTTVLPPEKSEEDASD